MVNGRAKGASFERSIASDLEAELGIKFKRDLDQYRERDRGDLIPVSCDNWPFLIECKRYAGTGVASPHWWEQACTAASKAGLMPLLIYKFDRRPVVARVPVQAMVRMADGKETYDWQYYCELTFAAFCMIARELLTPSPAMTRADKQKKEN
jgi:hypothetical protein